MLIAQISDMHVKADGRLAYGVVDTVRLLRECVAHVAALDPKPDVVAVTGDLVDLGHEEEYALVKDLLAPLDVPVLVLPGNHDERGALRRSFAGPGFEYLDRDGEFVQYALALGGIRFVALDTAIPGEPGGLLCARRLAWLDERLAEDATPTVVLMHHPPFATGIGHMDRMGLAGTRALAGVIGRHRHVERLLCGHLHRAIHARFAGTVASTCPSPAHQIALDLRPRGSDTFVMEPPGYQLHLWRDGVMVTHTHVLGSYPGPYSFGD